MENDDSHSDFESILHSFDGDDHADRIPDSNDPSVSVGFHPASFRRRIPANTHRIIREEDEGKEDRKGREDRTVSSAPSSPRRGHRPVHRSQSMTTSTLASASSPADRSTTDVSVDLSQLTLMDFEHHEHDLPERVPEDVLLRILRELDDFLTSFTTITNINDLSDQWMSIRNRLYSIGTHYLPVTLDINIEYERMQFTIGRLYQKFLQNELIEQQSGVTESVKSRALTNQFARLYNIIYNVRTVLFSHARNRAISEQKHYEMGQFYDYVNPGYFSFLLFEDLSPHQEFLLHVLDMAAQKNYRKKWLDYPNVGETVCLYEQILTPDGFPTHAWHRTSSLEEFVHKLIPTVTAAKQWKQFTGSRGLLTYIKQFLQFSNDVRLPFLVRQRHIFSFKNGIYDADQQRFFTYDHPLPSSMVSAKYFPQDFDLNLLEMKTEDIPVPPLTRLFEAQNVPANAQLIVLALIGRFFHELNKHERWQVALFILGEPGTGKSTLGSFLQELFDGEDAGVLDSDMEKQFGVSAFMHAFLAVCTDVSERFVLSHTKMQAMIDGDYINVARKYLGASQFLWKTHLLLNANVIPPHWNEYGGNLLRRLVCVLFNVQIRGIETDIAKQLKEWAPNIIHKCNMAYRELAARWNKVPLWNTDLPEYFRGTREYIGGIMSPIQAFVQDSGYVEVTQLFNDTITIREFLKALDAFCHERGYPTKKWIPQLWNPTFRRFGLVQRGALIHNIKSTPEWQAQLQQQSRSTTWNAPFQNSVQMTQGE